MKNDKIIKIIRVAKKYYESHMDQKIIAQEEEISVSTVSRMLKKAEEMGYIKITVEYPVLSNEELSASLKKKYNLEKVFLVPKLSDAPVAVQEDVCTCFFDARGEAVSSSFAKRRISITLEELKKIPCKIGVASGLEKKEALHAALLGEYINILYADEELGKELIAI